MWNNQWKKEVDYPEWGDNEVYKKTIGGGYLYNGETPKEALKEIETAMKLWIETAKKHGKPIPKPKSKKVNEPKKRFNVMFPESLLHDVDEYRGKHGMKRSELLAAAAEEYISSAH